MNAKSFVLALAAAGLAAAPVAASAANPASALSLGNSAGVARAGHNAKGSALHGSPGGFIVGALALAAVVVGVVIVVQNDDDTPDSN